MGVEFSGVCGELDPTVRQALHLEAHTREKESREGGVGGEEEGNSGREG